MMKYKEIAKMKMDSSEKGKYQQILDVQFKPSKITSNYIMLVFLDMLSEDGVGFAAQVKEMFNDVLPRPSFMSLSNGNLYPIIKEMREEGYIEYDSQGPRNSKYYKITKKGKKVHKELKAALEDEIDQSIDFYKSLKSLIYDK